MAVRHQQEMPGFGTLLRQHRTVAGLSQEALAERAGLSTRAISDLERGVKKRPHPATMRLLADALGLGAEERTELAAASRPDSGATHPPPSGLDRLPLPVSSIVGRASEIASAVEMIRSGATRLLTLTGPGGVGKTRLSLEIARSLAPEFPDGAVFVELAPVADPALVVPTVAAALKLRETGGIALVGAIRDVVQSGRMLLVLDNCEHMLDPVRSLIVELLASAPKLMILATSRSPLRVQGEQLLPLDPLPVPGPDQARQLEDAGQSPAIDLFVQRARAVRPEFALTEDNARDVADICARLDGLPLAIELAATRIRALSPAALAGLLSERLRLLTTGPQDAPARQQTLRAAIEWSHNLLDAGQQQFFHRLAVFTGGCTLETATDVAANGDTFAALDHLEALVDQGLVLRSGDRDGELRFRMLETVRELALEHLAGSDESATVHVALADTMLALAQRAGSMLHGAEPQRWLDRLEREQDNFRAALSWSLGESGTTGDAAMALRLAAALWPFWHMRGHLQEGHTWLERAIAQGDRVDPATRAAAFLFLANIANNLEDHTRARALYQQSRSLFRGRGNMQGVAAALVGLGMVSTTEGDYDLAATCLHDGLAAHAQTGASGGFLPCVYGLARLAMAKGDLDEAERRFIEARAMCDSDNTGFLAYLSLEVAQLERYRGNITVATQLADQCLAQFHEIGERRAEASTRVELGHLAILQQDDLRAIEYFRHAAETHLELRDELGVVACLEGLAALAVQRHLNDLAARLTSAADAWRTRTGTIRTAPEECAHSALTSTMVAALGNDLFHAAWASGKSTGIEEAYADAGEMFTSKAAFGSDDTHQSAFA